MQVIFKGLEPTPIFLHSEPWEGIHGYTIFSRVFIAFPDGVTFSQQVEAYYGNDADGFDGLDFYDTDYWSYPLTCDVDDCPYKDIPF